MKKIINRKTGNTLSTEEALALCKQVKTKTGAPYIEHTSVYGYATADIAEKANLRAIIEAHDGYIFAFIGAVNKGFEGYKVCAIATKIPPCDFEAHFPDYVVLG